MGDFGGDLGQRLTEVLEALGVRILDVKVKSSMWSTHIAGFMMIRYGSCRREVVVVVILLSPSLLKLQKLASPWRPL